MLDENHITSSVFHQFFPQLYHHIRTLTGTVSFFIEAAEAKIRGKVESIRKNQDT